MHTNRRLTSAEWTRLLTQPRDYGAAGYEWTRRRLTSVADLSLWRIVPLTSLEPLLPNRRNRQFWSQNCRFYIESSLSNDQRVEYCFNAAVLTLPFAFSCIVVTAFFSASISAATTVDGRKEESYYFEPAKISLGAFSGP